MQEILSRSQFLTRKPKKNSVSSAFSNGIFLIGKPINKMHTIRLATDTCGKIKIVEILNTTTTNDKIENSNNDSLAKAQDVRLF